MMNSSMTRQRGPCAIALVVMGLAGWLVWAGPSSAKATQPGPVIPEQLGPWHGVPRDVDARTLEILQTDDVRSLEFRRGGEPAVWVSQVAGFGNRATFHPPELCYVGSHFQVLERRQITVRIQGKPQRVMRLLLGQKGKRYEAWYWFTVNGRMTPNYYQQQLWLVKEAILGRASGGTLVRIVTSHEDPAKAAERLGAFMDSLAAAPAVMGASGQAQGRSGAS